MSTMRSAGMDGDSWREAERLISPSGWGRVYPSSSIQIALVSMYALTTSRPLSRPQPLDPTPPNGTSGAATR